MRHPSRFRCPGCAALTLAAASLVPAVADAQYLDPGAAGIIVQAVVAGIVAVGATLKLYWGRIARFFSRRRPRDQNGDVA